MAKKNENQEPVELPVQLVVDPEMFDSMPGDSFGGESEILLLDEGMVAGPLSYLGHRLTDLGNNMGPADIHEAKDSEGDTWRLPIAANFRRQAEGANLQRGDTFYVKRLTDAVKKAGKGKGNAMQMYQVKVTNRAPVAAVVS